MKRFRNFQILFGNDGMKKFRVTSKKKKGKIAKKENSANIAKIINHTQVTIINDIQHNGSNVE